MNTLETPTPSRYLKAAAAARYLGLCRRTLRTITDDGRIKSSKVGARSILYDRADLDSFVETHKK